MDLNLPDALPLDLQYRLLASVAEFDFEHRKRCNDPTHGASFKNNYINAAKVFCPVCGMQYILIIYKKG